MSHRMTDQPCKKTCSRTSRTRLPGAQPLSRPISRKRGARLDPLVANNTAREYPLGAEDHNLQSFAPRLPVR